VTHRRFDRTARLLGDAGVARLASSTVTVFGVGGVGSAAAEALVRSGVGRLILVDYDRICVTNVNFTCVQLRSRTAPAMSRRSSSSAPLILIGGEPGDQQNRAQAGSRRARRVVMIIHERYSSNAPLRNSQPQAPKPA
jgi:hypothetical protein